MRPVWSKGSGDRRVHSDKSHFLKSNEARKGSDSRPFVWAILITSRNFKSAMDAPQDVPGTGAGWRTTRSSESRTRHGGGRRKAQVDLSQGVIEMLNTGRD